MGTMEPQPQDKPVVLLASPRGFCAGVRRAIRIVELAIEKGKGPIYVRHEIVHNKAVVEDLAARGAVFVEELDEVPDGATVIFSAHGVGRDVETAAAARSLDVIDATCPLVTKVHLEVARHARRGAHVILIGHRGHPEVVGTMGQLPDGSMTLVENPEGADTVKIPNAAHLAFAMQTTLSVDDARATVERLSSRFPGIEGPATDDICFATTNRQHAARQLAEQCDAVLVVGSANSSNSKRLMETAQRMGVSAQLIDDDRDINWQALAGITRIGVTAGASAPEAIVQRVAAAVAKFVGASEAVELEGVYERETFALPPRFRQADDPR